MNEFEEGSVYARADEIFEEYKKDIFTLDVREAKKTKIVALLFDPEKKKLVNRNLPATKAMSVCLSEWAIARNPFKKVPDDHDFAEMATFAANGLIVTYDEAKNSGLIIPGRRYHEVLNDFEVQHRKEHEEIKELKETIESQDKKMKNMFKACPKCGFNGVEEGDVGETG